ncbi:hypothetical protein L218DRAFT_970140 [Marasmius fiardii PR-910]|nr:hypothetical protein L218DRAFT_970140 [Marasmius fiardii PR-910]
MSFRIEIQKNLTATGEPDFLSKPPSPRRLPSLPRERPVSYSRPLPPVPRTLSCKKCHSRVTSISFLLPLEAIPQNSRAFRGFSGKASLFTEIHHVRLAAPRVRLMATGAHTMQEITCLHCSSYLGWKINRAHDRSEQWKEGHYLLELENLLAEMSSPRIRDDSSSSDSDDSSC